MILIQATIGFLFLMVLMGAALFCTAGTLGFWQAWTYLAVFGGSTILITIYLVIYDREFLIGRLKVGPIAETKRQSRLTLTFFSYNVIFLLHF